MSKRVIFVGSNPSSKAKNQYSAFSLDTKSGRTLAEWMKLIDLDREKCCMTNISHYRTLYNRPLSDRAIKMNLDTVMKTLIQVKIDNPKLKIVALGKTATKGLKWLNLPFFEMDHPSGLNRKLNNKSYIENKLKELKEYLDAT